MNVILQRSLRSGFTVIFFAFLSLHSSQEAETPLDIPAFTAYSEPNPDSITVSDTGVSEWTDGKQQLVWYGELKRPGTLNPAVSLRLPHGATSRFQLLVTKVGGGTKRQSRTAVVRGTDSDAALSFAPVEIASPGYYRFALKGVEKTGASFGDPLALHLTGAAAQNAHFNVKPRRNAASVHLGYPIPPGEKVTRFTNEVTVKTDPVGSYYMACGFHRGYFGIQVNSPTERRIIFSVWDSSAETVDRSKVRAEDRVQLLAKGEGVYAGDFGNEGTGGHSHLVYPWKTGRTYRFLITAKPDGTAGIYSGYFYFPDRHGWGLIARFRAPRDEGSLRGLYSFNEDFIGENGQLRRLALFGPGWVKTDTGEWNELTTARFTHDETGKEDRKDYGAGVMGKRFFLSNGGFVSTPVTYGDTLHRTATHGLPTDIPTQLP